MLIPAVALSNVACPGGFEATWISRRGTGIETIKPILSNRPGNSEHFAIYV